ncbi:DUF6745 domain-containing protein [Streptomyces sp. NPDC050988]|uniref:DUF6745 domain-containing protein n=1 Tax=Streptomyces sp. NPDC050988 TaxID=3365637 RepID=UPI0037A2E46F
MFGRTRALTPGQVRQAEDVMDEWLSWSLSTEPADREATEEAVAELYRIQGLPPPTFLWVDSPMSGQLVAWLLVLCRSVPSGVPRHEWLHQFLSPRAWKDVFGRSVMDSVVELLDGYLQSDDPPLPDVFDTSFAQRLHSVPGTWHRGALRALSAAWWHDPHARRHPGVWLWRRSMRLTTWEEWDVQLVGRFQAPGWVRETFELQLPRPNRLIWAIRDHCWAGFDDLEENDDLLLPYSELGGPSNVADFSRVHGQWATQLGWFDAYRRLELVRYPGSIERIMDLLTITARSCGSWWPSERLCVAVERPARLKVDLPRPRTARPHCADGPAVAWRDGSELYAWRGIPVSERLIKGNLSAADWLAESNSEVRRAMAERMGYEWLLDSANAKKIATDEYGTLWRITERYEEDIVLVDLVNSTPEPDGSFKRYVLRVPPDQTVPRDAIGWTFGLPPGAYGPATMT